MPQQLSRQSKAVRSIIRQLEDQEHALENTILGEPTGEPRNELTAANIHLKAALEHLREIV